MKVSKKYIINIRKFMSNFVLKDYTGNKKLTHLEMVEYLFSNGIDIPNRVPYKKINDNSILNGDVIFVEDENKKVLPYLNPLMFNSELLMESLESDKSKKACKTFRKNYLISKGYIEEDGKLIKINTLYDEEDLDNKNRIKKLSKRRI